jgi:hypothetical protein
MRRLRAWGAGALLLALAPLGTWAYGPATVKRLTDVSLRLAPPALRSALLAYRPELDRGVAEALSSYGTAPRPAVVEAAQHEFDLLPTLPRDQAPFQVIAYHFGRLAGLVYAVNDPLLEGKDARALEVHADYLGYVERKLPLMIFAFDGYDRPPLDGDLTTYLSARLRGEVRYRDAVLFCYFPKDTRVSSDTFDDRSNAFGVAQVFLSHAVSDAVKAWVGVWKAMDGDLSATPFYHPEGAAADP